MPSGKPEDKCGGKELLPPINGKKGKGKAKNSKPLLQKTFRVDPRTTPRQDYAVAINVDGRPATKEDRWVQMAALAFTMAIQQSSSTQPPIYLQDSRVGNGTILLWCDSAASQESILGMLSNQDGITLTPRGAAEAGASFLGFRATWPICLGRWFHISSNAKTRNWRRVVCSMSHCTMGLDRLYLLMLISVLKSIWKITTSGLRRSHRI